MTSDGFLSRWSRRKASVRQAPPVAPPAEAAPEAAPALPDIETLDGSSDYTAFLQKGVTAEIQRRALQRAWESDAGIAAFRGMADYDWDFNAPSYGRLWATDDVGGLLRAVLASPPPPAPLPAPDPDPDPDPEPEPAVAGLPGPSVLALTDGPVVAAAEPAPEPAVRRHGSALPC